MLLYTELILKTSQYTTASLFAFEKYELIRGKGAMVAASGTAATAVATAAVATAAEAGVEATVEKRRILCAACTIVYGLRTRVRLACTCTVYVCVYGLRVRVQPACTCTGCVHLYALYVRVQPACGLGRAPTTLTLSRV